MLPQPAPCPTRRCMNETTTLHSGENYSGITFSNIFAARTNLTFTRFVACTLEQVDLSGATLSGASFTRTTFDECDLGRMDGQGIELMTVEASDSYLTGTNLSDSFVTSTKWRGCTGDRISIDGANVREANLTDCQIRELTGSLAQIEHVSLGDVDAGRLHLSDCDITDLEARTTLLTSGRLDGVRIDDSSLKNCDMHWLTITGSWIDRLELDACNTTGMVIRDTTFTNSVFSQVFWDKMACERVAFDSCTFDEAESRAIWAMVTDGLILLRGHTNWV